jgi:hypothetical protein
MRVLIAFILIVLGCAAPASAQSIANDPFIRQGIDRANFEPGGKYFNFRDRGTIISRSGGFRITPTSTVSLGSYSLQNGILAGRYQYVNDLDDAHPISVHNPYTNDVHDTAGDRQRNQGSQSSYQFDYTGQELHPGDGYDGPPAGAGARDIYTYEIQGIATALYVQPPSTIQNADQGEYFDRLIQFGGAGLDRIGQGFVASWEDPFLVNRANGVLDVSNGIFQTLYSPLAAGMSPFADDIMAFVIASTDSGILHGFSNEDIETQYAQIESVATTESFLEANPIVGNAAELALNIAPWYVGGKSATGVSQFAKTAKADAAVRRVRHLLESQGESIGVKGNSLRVRIVESDAELRNIFEELSASGRKMQTRMVGRVVEIQDGSRVLYRPNSKSNGPALEIHGVDGRNLKFHVKQK